METGYKSLSLLLSQQRARHIHIFTFVVPELVLRCEILTIFLQRRCEDSGPETFLIFHKEYKAHHISRNNNNKTTYERKISLSRTLNFCIRDIT